MSSSEQAGVPCMQVDLSHELKKKTSSYGRLLFPALQSTHGKSCPEWCNPCPAWCHLWTGQNNLISLRPHTLQLLFMAFWSVFIHRSISIKEMVSHHYGALWQKRWCRRGWHQLSLLCNIWGHLLIIFILLEKIQPAAPIPACFGSSSLPRLYSEHERDKLNQCRKGSLMSNWQFLVPDVSCSVSE